MSQKNTLFVHYGPGGNAQVEEKWLSQDYGEVLFHDLVIDSSSEVNFELMLQSYDKVIHGFEKGSKIKIVGHSFGSDLALALADKYSERVSELVLLSPIRDLPFAFLNLGCRLLESEDRSDSLQTSVDELRVAIDAGVGILDKLWAFVGEAFKVPTILDEYWCEDLAYEKYKEFSKDCKPMDLSIWQVGISDYIAKDRRVYDLDISAPVKVVLGDKDPYYKISEEKVYWAQRLGLSHLKVVESCGHYPHLEKGTLDFF